MEAGVDMSLVNFDVEDYLAIVTINRPEARNAVDHETSQELASAFRRFDADESLSVAILTGLGGVFCAGADLKAVATGKGNRVTADGDGPLGCTRMLLSKPVIAAVEGHAVAGGLELALWCDMRVAARDAIFGVFCRRFGVPLIDGGTVRLPRLIGMSNAMDMILTGRGVSGDEALRMGLANRMVERGEALTAAKELARANRGISTALHAVGSHVSLRGMDDAARRGDPQRISSRHRHHTVRRDARRRGPLRSGVGRHGKF